MAPIQGKKSNKVKVVLTGFQPFGVHVTNPSWLSIQALNNTTLEIPSILSTDSNHHKATVADVVSQELPVEYREVSELIPALHAQHSRKIPSTGQVVQEEDKEKEKEEDYLKIYYIHLGVGRRDHTAIETKADRTGYNRPDNAK
ncbi:hypothetical protein BGZ65_010189, partial [Modicella reniformis]